jgi:hypothetical protein
MTRFMSVPCLAALLLTAGCSLSLPSKFSSKDADNTDSPEVCPEGQALCGDLCVDLSSDPRNCGRCGIACRPDQVCSGGSCACSVLMIECGGQCVDTNSNPDHCGGCNIACPEGMVCSGGVCAAGCGEGLVNCSGACVDLTSNPSNCGGCGVVCPGAVGADPACVNSVCGLSCWQNRWDLDGAPGCEYECVFTSVIEMCDGTDNDCNGERDEIFSCISGSEVPCITSCGSEGSGMCTESCSIPAGGDCVPPEEICNGIDDDCDMVIDEGCPPSPPNDTCASPTDVTAGGRFTGSTAAATDNSTGWCGGTPGGRDVFFTFQLSAYSDVFVSSFGSAFDTVLYAGSTCGASDLACSDDLSDDVRQGFLRFENLAPGTYTIALDGKNGSERGDYVLDVYISPVDDYADKCGRVVRLTAAGESGSTCGYSDDYSGSCDNPSPSGAPDRVFFFVVPNATPSASLTFSTCNTTTTYDSLMYIRRVCSDGGTEVVCVDDAGCSSAAFRSIITTTLTPGVYYLFIDAYGNSAGECGNYLITTS